MVYIGIDPGKSGAMAVIERVAGCEEVVEVFPFDPPLYRKVLDWCRTREGCGCVLERVNAMPKQGVKSMFSFGGNYERIQEMLESREIPYELVTPAKWKKEFGVTSDKNTSIAVAQRLFPQVSLLRTEKCRKPDDGIAEALLLACYAQRHMGGAEK